MQILPHDPCRYRSLDNALNPAIDSRLTHSLDTPACQQSTEYEINRSRIAVPSRPERRLAFHLAENLGQIRSNMQVVVGDRNA